MSKIQTILNHLSVFANRNDLPKSFVDLAFPVNEDGCKFCVLSMIRKNRFFEIFNIQCSYRMLQREKTILQIFKNRPCSRSSKTLFLMKNHFKTIFQESIMAVITCQVIILPKVRDVGCNCNYVISYQEIWVIRNLSILGLPSQFSFFLGSFVENQLRYYKSLQQV